MSDVAVRREPAVLKVASGIDVRDTVHIVAEPGNGTRYDVLGFRISGRIYTGGRLGSITDGWLVVLGNNGRAYLFGHHDVVASWYVQEKLGVALGDSLEVARVIAEIVEGEVVE